MKSIVNILPIVFLVFAALVFSSCSNDEPLEQIINENEIRIDAIHPSQQTRASSMGFEKEDRIGVFVVQEGSILQPYGNIVNNGCYTYDGNQWIPSRTFYWNEGINDVYAYYPYTDGLEEVETFPFKIYTDQSTTEGYYMSDFLWSKAEGQQAGSSPVSLKFSHVMSRALVEIMKGENYEGDLPEEMEVYLHNTVTTANIDLASGGVYKDAYAGAESIKMQKVSNNMYAAIVVPQNITTRRPLVEVIMGNVSYLMEGTINFKQKHQHTITVIVTENPQQAEINIGGVIGNWN